MAAVFFGVRWRPRVPAPTWTPPNEFEEYRLARRLGHGAMGQVWLAHDLLLDRRVAIKFIGSLSTHPQIRERFLNEARAIARLSHPNVVTVHRIGTLDGQPFMVSEHIEGQSLDQLPMPIDVTRALSIGVELARGLACAHRAGVLHRDVKPANAMLTLDGAAKLLDFGLAKFAEATTPVVPVESTPVPVSAALDPDATPAPDLDSGVTYSSPRSSPANLTLHGTVLGTPLYLAPECWLGEAATRRSDVYSLGALLYELCAGQPPVRFLGEGELRELATSKDARPLIEVAPQVSNASVQGSAFSKVIDRCLARDASSRFASGDELREALERLRVKTPVGLPAGNPYRGLAAFDAEHAALFFGREAETRAAIDRLRQRSLVVVAGESGVGKSSLVRAGIAPLVQSGSLGDGRAWTVVTCLPGRHPLRSLAGVCASQFGLGEEALFRALEAEPRSLARAAVQALGAKRGLLVVIDQLEEWVTFAEGAETEQAALAVAGLCEGFPGLRVVTTARIDLLSRLSALPGLGPELVGGLLLLGPVQREHVEQIVTRPAEAFGVRFESPALVERFVTFVTQGGPLPLLQFALARLWEGRGTSNVLTEANLAAMGGVSGALAQHADAVIDKLPAEQRAVAPSLLLSLVSGSDRRRRRAESELATEAARKAALATLASARLVLARDSVDGTVWEIAHEALLREWPTLRRWLSEDADAHALQEKLSTATQEWERLGFAPEALWGDRQLAEAELTLTASPALAQTLESSRFLAASRRRARARRWRLPIGLIAGTLIIALGIGGVRWLSARATLERAGTHLTQADKHQQAAAEAKVVFERARDEAFRVFDEGDWPRGEELWATARATRDVWAKQLSLARAETETAQLLAPTHPGLAVRMSLSAEQRLAFDEALGLEPEIESELRRLEALGASADQLAKLSAPATALISVTPPDATIRLAQWEGTGAHATLGPLTILLPGPVTLRPASYQLQLSAPGFAPVSLPFVARRGAKLTLDVKLMPETLVPAGFIHVPGGRSLVGSAGDESVRREFYEAAPLHEVLVSDFLIARREVRFRDWLDYLEALPEKERALRTPRIDSSLGTADTANLTLTRDPTSNWILSFKPVTKRYTARAGEPIRYEDRDRNMEQDWLELPVVGISPLDAEAYAAWLDSTARVPGARLCREYEWERAARGADGRTLPHGEVVSPDDANIDETYGRKDAAFGPDAVGLHPSSRSPFGVDDMLGNVWEIVRPTSRAKAWANKGGSWQVNALSARAPNQWVINPGYRQVETGIRICATPAQRTEPR